MAKIRRNEGQRKIRTKRENPTYKINFRLANYKKFQKNTDGLAECLRVIAASGGLPPLYQALKLETIAIALSFDSNEKVEQLDLLILNDESGLFKYFCFGENEFMVSDLVPNSVSNYWQINFLLPELRKKILETGEQLYPGVGRQYDAITEAYKKNYNIDLQSLINSIGNISEGFAIHKKDNEIHNIVLNRLANSDDFKTNFTNGVNNSAVHGLFSKFLSFKPVNHEKEQLWEVTAMQVSDAPKPFALLLKNEYLMIVRPFDEHSNYIQKFPFQSEAKLNNSIEFSEHKSFYPKKLGFYYYSKNRDLVKEMLEMIKRSNSIDTKDSEISQLLKQISLEKYTGFLSFGIWREPSELRASVRLTLKDAAK